MNIFTQQDLSGCTVVGAKNRKRKTGNSESTPFPVSQQVTRTGFEINGIFLLFSNSVRKSLETIDLIKTNI